MESHCGLLRCFRHLQDQIAASRRLSASSELRLDLDARLMSRSPGDLCA